MKDKHLLLNHIVTSAIAELQEGENPAAIFEAIIDWIMDAVEQLHAAQKVVHLDHVFNLIQWLRQYRRITEEIATGDE